MKKKRSFMQSIAAAPHVFWAALFIVLPLTIVKVLSIDGVSLGHNGLRNSRTSFDLNWELNFEERTHLLGLETTIKLTRANFCSTTN